MQAWRATEPRAQPVRHELPDPDSTGLVIDVLAAGVGFPDLLLSRGEFQIRQATASTLGWEAVGCIRSVPDGSPLRVGQRVVTLSFGAFAEQLVAVPEVTFPAPMALSDEEAAAWPLNYLTAYAALRARADVQAGETVVVHGAGGGVGSACVRLAAAFGARVVGVVSSQAKAQVARTAGASETVIGTGGWRGQVQALAPGGVDVVIDPVGGDRLTDGLRVLRSRGRLVVLGFAAGGAIPQVSVNRLLIANTSLMGCTWSGLADRPWGLAEAVAELTDLTASGALAPVVGTVVPFGRLPDGLATLSDRRSTGKTVLRVGA